MGFEGNGRSMFPGRHAIICAALLTSISVFTAANQTPSPIGKSPAEILRDSGSSVALIASADDNAVGLGSGFFIEDGTALVTNFHVVEGAKAVVVKLASGEIRNVTELWAYDAQWDLAILKIDPPQAKTVVLGNSEAVTIGEPVTVVSNPEGLERSVTNGLISGLRTFEGRTQFQISAPISPGSSGGPVFDVQGKVIGVVRAYLSEGQNLNFAIPINNVARLWESRQLVALSSLPSRPQAQQETTTSAIDGSWSATFADSISSGQLAFTLVDDGGHVKGTYTSSLGGGGSVQGTISGQSFSFQLTQAIRDCSGTFKGSAVVHANTMSGTYSGRDCQGDHLSGSFTMTRGSAITTVPQQAAPVQPVIEYGSSSELRGARKVFVYTDDVDVRLNINKELSKEKELVTIVGSAAQADVILIFGAQSFSMGNSTYVWSDAYGNTYGNSTPRYGVTGVGSVVRFVAPNRVRVVWQFSTTRVSAFQRRPSTNFARNFLKELRNANQ